MLRLFIILLLFVRSKADQSCVSEVFFESVDGSTATSTENNYEAPKASLLSLTGLWSDILNAKLFVVDGFNQNVGTISLNKKEFNNKPAVNHYSHSPERISQICGDNHGHLYGYSSMASKVSKTQSTGLWLSFAGTGSVGFSGDGGPATNAQFAVVASCAVDNNGDVYLADQNNHRIRKVDHVSNIVTTFAGNGRKASVNSVNSHTSSTVSAPNSLFIDTAGNFFVSESAGRILKVMIGSDHFIVYSAFTGASDSNFYSKPGYVTSVQFPGMLKHITGDEHGNLFLASPDNPHVYLISSESTLVTNIAGSTTKSKSNDDDGSATSGLFMSVSSMASFTGGRLFVADTKAANIRLLTCSYSQSTVDLEVDVAADSQMSHVLHRSERDNVQHSTPLSPLSTVGKNSLSTFVQELVIDMVGVIPRSFHYCFIYNISATVGEVRFVNKGKCSHFKLCTSASINITIDYFDKSDMINLYPGKMRSMSELTFVSQDSDVVIMIHKGPTIILKNKELADVTINNFYLYGVNGRDFRGTAYDRQQNINIPDFITAKNSYIFLGVAVSILLLYKLCHCCYPHLVAFAVKHYHEEFRLEIREDRSKYMAARSDSSSDCSSDSSSVANDDTKSRRKCWKRKVVKVKK